MEPVIKKLQTEVLDPNGIILEKINVDPNNSYKFEEPKAQRFKLLGVPTFITLEDEVEIGRRHGGSFGIMKSFIKQSFPDLQIH